MQFKGTRPPWRVQESDLYDGLDFYIITDKGALGYYPAPDKDGFPVVTWTKEDAQLISAAPDLLEAAKNIIMHRNQKDLHPKDFQRLEQAINKALGK